MLIGISQAYKPRLRRSPKRPVLDGYEFVQHWRGVLSFLFFFCGTFFLIMFISEMISKQQIDRYGSVITKSFGVVAGVSYCMTLVCAFVLQRVIKGSGKAWLASFDESEWENFQILEQPAVKMRRRWFGGGRDNERITRSIIIKTGCHISMLDRNKLSSACRSTSSRVQRCLLYASSQQNYYLCFAVDSWQKTKKSNDYIAQCSCWYLNYDRYRKLLASELELLQILGVCLA